LGYNSTVTTRINEMQPNDMKKGFLAIDPITTPISNMFMGGVANRVFTLFTG